MARTRFQPASFSLPCKALPSRSGLRSLEFVVISLFVFLTTQVSAQSSGADAVVDAIAENKSFNVYQADSLDPLIDLGLLLQEQDNHEEAIGYFKQARQASRIQNGLFDETQVLLTEAIIESELALKNWEEVDQHFQHMEYLYHKLYDLEDPRLEAGLGKVTRWLSFSLSANPVGDRIDQLHRANRLYKLRLRIAEQTLEPDHPKVAFLLENIAICEKQLYPMPSHDRDRSRRANSSRARNPVIASLD